MQASVSQQPVQVAAACWDEQGNRVRIPGAESTVSASLHASVEGPVIGWQSSEKAACKADIATWLALYHAPAKGDISFA